MSNKDVLAYLEKVVEQSPEDWRRLTTHRLDIYHEEKAKIEFLEEFERLFEAHKAETNAFAELPTAYDYIRLGHPLSSILEWALAKFQNIANEQVIAFASQTMPLLAILRKNYQDEKNTLLLYRDQLPAAFDEEIVKSIYGFQFETQKLAEDDSIPHFKGSTVLIEDQEKVSVFEPISGLDFHLLTYPKMGSVLTIHHTDVDSYVSAIQHVRRRETIAMTPEDCYIALQQLTGQLEVKAADSQSAENRAQVIENIQSITGTDIKPLIASSGLSTQYAIMMGLVDDALERHPNHDIKIIVPPNCYGGTNDQARRLAAVHPKVEILDLPVDGNNDMVQSTEQVLEQVAQLDAIPYIIAEIPTNPRVEVPDLKALRAALSKERKTVKGEDAIPAVFILDQTFCPNVQFLAENNILSKVRSIAYVSGSKFPSGGKCTAGYCTANHEAADLMPKIERHLKICENQATDLQIALLAEQMPSMLERIQKAYENTRDFVSFIRKSLPEAKINFVSDEVVEAGFTPSVFSLDLPTKGKNEAEREAYKRELNLKLIKMMIEQIPQESKYCVSYGQLKGCYWTIPATSTQGTTKEGDKDYIVRVSISPDFDLQQHQAVFKQFVEEL